MDLNEIKLMHFSSPLISTRIKDFKFILILFFISSCGPSTNTTKQSEFQIEPKSDNIDYYNVNVSRESNKPGELRSATLELYSNFLIKTTHLPNEVKIERIGPNLHYISNSYVIQNDKVHLKNWNMIHKYYYRMYMIDYSIFRGALSNKLNNEDWELTEYISTSKNQISFTCSNNVSIPSFEINGYMLRKKDEIIMEFSKTTQFKNEDSMSKNYLIRSTRVDSQQWKKRQTLNLKPDNTKSISDSLLSINRNTTGYRFELPFELLIR